MTLALTFKASQTRVQISAIVTFLALNKPSIQCQYPSRRGTKLLKYIILLQESSILNTILALAKWKKDYLLSDYAELWREKRRKALLLQVQLCYISQGDLTPS